LPGVPRKTHHGRIDSGREILRCAQDDGKGSSEAGGG
jgi:hypothetical protein